MKRWRRPLILIALLLLAGAVVNVAVAWVLVGAPDSWTRGGPRKSLLNRGADGQISAAQSREVGWRLAGSDLDHAWITLGLGWRVVSAGYYKREPLPERWWKRTVEAGWPARSMVLVGQHSGNAMDPWNDSPSMRPPRRLLPGAAWFPIDRPGIPLAPIPVGFAINTLFYALVVGAILALPLSFFPIRRRLRARRGRCQACGYDLAGAPAPGGGGVCPECGAGRRNVAPPPNSDL